MITVIGNFIYGSSVIKKNNDKLTQIKLNYSNSIYTKVVSPNLGLRYDLSQKDIEGNIVKLIKYSDPDKGKKNFIYLA